MKPEYTHATDCGNMIKASFIQLGSTGATVAGYVQDCPRTRYKIAIRADGSGWEALYDQGGDDCGISSDNLHDIISIGRMDDDCDTVAKALREGASELRLWAARIRAIDEHSEQLAECADYLDERAADAAATAEDNDSCNDIADEVGMEQVIHDDEAAQ